MSVIFDMTRRQILKSLFVLIVVPQVAYKAAAKTPPILFVTWIERFYRAQIAVRAITDGRATPEDHRDADPNLTHPLRDYLTPDMQRMFDALPDKPRPLDKPDGPVLDYIFGWDAFPGRDIKLVSVIETSLWLRPITRDIAQVTILLGQHERTLTIKGTFAPETNSWKIENIDYGEWLGKTLRESLEHATR